MSKYVKIISGSGRNRKVVKQSLNKTARQVEEERVKRLQLYAALSGYGQRETFMTSGGSGTAGDGHAEPDDNSFDVDGDGPIGPPPAQEGTHYSPRGDEELLDLKVNGASSKKKLTGPELHERKARYKADVASGAISDKSQQTRKDAGTKRKGSDRSIPPAKRIRSGSVIEDISDKDERNDSNEALSRSTAGDHQAVEAESAGSVVGTSN